MEGYEALKKEFKSTKFRNHMKDSLPNECTVCGNSDCVEYHHIVPLRLGGTNSLKNIIPLCHSCHEKAHGAQTIRRDYKSLDTGRKRKLPDEQAEKILKDYFLGKIGKQQAEQAFGCSNKYSKLNDTQAYKDFKKAHGIVRNRNLIDIRAAKGSKTSALYIVADILFDDDTWFFRYSDGTILGNDVLKDHGFD